MALSQNCLCKVTMTKLKLLICSPIHIWRYFIKFICTLLKNCLTNQLEVSFIWRCHEKELSQRVEEDEKGVVSCQKNLTITAGAKTPNLGPLITKCKHDCLQTVQWFLSLYVYIENAWKLSKLQHCIFIPMMA